MAGDALPQVGATVTEWSRTDYTAIVATTTRALLVAAAWLAATWTTWCCISKRS